MPSCATVLDVANLKFSYGKEAPVIDVKKFSIAAGEKLFMYGPSGSGKTTLLGLIAGVLNPNSGSICILENNVVPLSASRRDKMRCDHMGYIFQMFNLIPYLNVIENILLPLKLSTVRSAKLTVGGIVEEARSLCAALDLQGFEEKSVMELSVGQQQRVAAARALIGGPELLIADEPTSALDFDRREGFLKLLFKQCERYRTAVLFVSHDRTLQSLFDRSVALPEINEVNCGAMRTALPLNERN